jgi:hypothetical protein
MPKSEKHKMLLLLKDNYDELLNLNENSSVTKIVIKHNGVINQEIIHRVTQHVEDFLLDQSETKVNTKRMFSILIEGLQNIFMHGEPEGQEDKMGACLVNEKDAGYEVHFINAIDSNKTGVLKDYLDQLNMLSIPALKERYRQTLSEGVISEKGGAGLGYLTIRLKSQSPIFYNFSEPVGDLNLLYTKITLNRNEG